MLEYLVFVTVASHVLLYLYMYMYLYRYMYM